VYKISWVDVLVFYVFLFGVVMLFLTADQEHQHVSVCKELRQIASSVQSFPGLSLVMTAGFMVRL
jgi:hypothetical protein